MPLSTRRLAGLALAVLSSLMLGLAAGAIWMVATMYLRQALPWLAVPLGIALAIVIRSTVQRPGVIAAVLAGSATTLATIYVNMLIAGVQIAGNMGMGLIDTLRTAGISMLWQLARLAAGPADLGWAMLAALLAAWLAWRSPVQRR